MSHIKKISRGIIDEVRSHVSRCRQAYTILLSAYATLGIAAFVSREPTERVIVADTSRSEGFTKQPVRYVLPLLEITITQPRRYILPLLEISIPQPRRYVLSLLEISIPQPRQANAEEAFRGIFRTSHYYTALERFSSNWRGFYRAVRMEGYGVTREGLLCSYLNIKPRRTDSRCENKEELRGTAAYHNSELEVGRSVAVDPELIAFGSAVRLEFVLEDGKTCRTRQCSEWSGWYLAEDTGSAFKGKGRRALDIYAGFGTDGGSDGESYSIAEGLPYRVRVFVVPPGETASKLISQDYPTIRETASRHEFRLLRSYSPDALDLVVSLFPGYPNSTD